MGHGAWQARVVRGVSACGEQGHSESIVLVVLLTVLTAALLAGCGSSGGSSSTPSSTPSPTTSASAPTSAGVWQNPTALAVPRTPSAPGSASRYAFSVFAVNDLGMHCIQGDYSSFLILPPANFLKVQVFRKGGEGAQLVTSGIKVEYEVLGNTHSADKLNFWRYAADYGFDVKPDMGITGMGLKGTFSLSKDGKYWTADAIPVTPFLDNGDYQPYQAARITVKDQSGTVVARQPQVVLPVSIEMHCDNCHGADVPKSALQAHDAANGTHLWSDLQAGKRHACAECHQDNALGMPGKKGVLSLSEAMHGFHADKMSKSTVKMAEPCYNCHPGQMTKCLRGSMAAAGKSCSDPKCHGGMARVAGSIKNGRQPWLQEPDCANCHKNGANQGQLYRNSYLVSGPEEMNGKIQCEMCHNGTHSEWTSTLALDNSIPLALQSHTGVIADCKVCHQGSGKIHSGSGGG